MNRSLSIIGAGALLLMLSACGAPEVKPTSGDAMVPGTDYNATGSVACSMSGGAATGQCPFGVKRESYDGTGIVTITKPDGRTRSVYFEKGNAISYDMSQADPGKFSASKRSGMYYISIGQERYEIPESVIFGG
jgi:hypothetical protein